MPEQAPYILTKLLHGSQKKRKKHDESGLVITIEVVPNFELEQVILSYEEDCSVIEPENLKTKSRDRLGNVIKICFQREVRVYSKWLETPLTNGRFFGLMRIAIKAFFPFTTKATLCEKNSYST